VQGLTPRAPSCSSSTGGVDHPAGSGFDIRCLGSRVPGLRFWVSVFGFGGPNFGYQVLGFELRDSDIGTGVRLSHQQENTTAQIETNATTWFARNGIRDRGSNGVVCRVGCEVVGGGVQSFE